MNILFLMCSTFLLKVNDLECNNGPGEEDDGDTFGDDTLDDFEFNASTTQRRSDTSKLKWITPRLCAALDKSKVKRMRLEK